LGKAKAVVSARVEEDGSIKVAINVIQGPVGLWITFLIPKSGLEWDINAFGNNVTFLVSP